MQLNEAVSKRLTELLRERDMTQYQLYMKSGVRSSRAATVISPLMPEVPSMISVC